MKQLRLKSMHLENFKSVKELDIEFGSNLTRISGRNGSGKSTIVDAFCWVLFNTDSHGQAPGSDKFREKPLDETGTETHYLDTVVELDFDWNELPLKIKRLQRECWAKKRGFVDAVYGGNESQYWINGLEVKKSDYQARISEIAPLDVLKILASLGEFNRLSWQDRRVQLVALSDTDIDAGLLADEQFAQIAAEVARTGVAAIEQTKLAKERVKDLNARLKTCPIRIDEAVKALPDVDDKKRADAEYIINDSQTDIDKIDKTIAELRADNGGSDAQKQLAQLEIERAKLCAQLDNELRNKRAEASRQMEAVKASKQREVDYIGDLERRLKLAKLDVEKYTKVRDDLRADFREVAGKQIVIDTVCEVCGQTLPEDLAAEIYEQKVAKREQAKATIREAGRDAAARVDEAQKQQDEIAATLAAESGKLAEIEIEYKLAVNVLAAIPSKPDYDAVPQLAEIVKRIDGLHENGVTEVEDKIAGLTRRRNELQEIINRNRAVVARYEAAEETRKRIDALKAEQVELGKDLADAEKYVALTERYIRARCDLLTDSINSKFPSIKWKLFNEQINGAIADVCTCMIPCGGSLVAYETANTASQINADIEIIKVFSRECGISIPLFVDNAERVLELEDAETQTITLSVSADEGLKIQEG